ncbi:MAG: glycosyltransferase [Patescibacteria group bacterium]|nr:glycosyltransferase [Patescibacteria group bacterium]MDE1966125.1 glycosyltransferase [Patescibacteria group bacterium]
MDDSPKRVLYVITKATWGGAQRYVWDLMTHAHAYGYRPALAYGERGLLAKRAEAAGFDTYTVEGLQRDISPLKELAARRELIALFKKLSPDVVHLNSSKAGYTGVLAARAAGVSRVIFTAHGWAFTEKRSGLAKRLFTRLQRATVARADATIAVSDAIRSLAHAHGVPTERMPVIPLGIDAPAFSSRDAAREELIRRDPSLAAVRGNVWVGTIAELHANKGIDIGIEAWKLLPTRSTPTEWVIIGGGEEEGRLREKAREMPDIHFLGFVENAAQYLKAFDLFLLPSRTEAFAYVVLEAGAAGVPVVATDVGGVREATGYPIGTLAPSENPHALAKSIHAYLRDPESLARTGAALCAHVRNSFSLERTLSDTFALYEKA